MKNKTTMAVWNVKAQQFPENGSMESKLKFLIKYAILASSGHNTQPWKFKIGKNKLEVWADKDRRRRDIDPNDRELFISLGCAIANLEVAAKFFGMMYEKKYNDEKNGLAVIFKFTEGKIESREEKLFRAITERRVNREEYLERSIPKELLEKIEKENNGAMVHLIDQKKKQQEVAALLEKSDRVWFKTKKLVDEMEYWLQDDLSYGNNGIPAEIINLYKLAVEVKYLISRDSESVEEKALRDKKLAEKAGAIAVIWTKGESKKEWIEAGELYERMALYLTENGIQNAFFNTVIELNTQRKELENILGIPGRAQLMIRLGYAKKETSHSPRREVGAVLM
jgi:hypothetical protein